MDSILRTSKPYPKYSDFTYIIFGIALEIKEWFPSIKTFAGWHGFCLTSIFGGRIGWWQKPFEGRTGLAS
jgi:hypothetical protein